MRIGPRVWKTALAVTASIGISRMLGLHQPVFAGVAAIICMQPTIAGSVRKGYERMQATIIGALFSVAALIIIEHFPFLYTIRPVMIGLTVLAVMMLTIRLGWMDSLVLAAATVVVIMVLPANENIYLYSASRTEITFIGIVIATIINAVFVTPRYAGPLWKNIAELARSTEKDYRRAVEAFCLRKPELAGEATKSLDETHDLLLSAQTAVERVCEEAELRKTMRRPRESETDLLVRVVETLESIRLSVSTILRVTAEVLENQPGYIQHSARVYEILWELAQPGFAIFGRLVEDMASDQAHADRGIPGWSEDLHKQFIKGIRDGHQEVFPLVEISVVEFEIRRVTESLSEIESLIGVRP
jgi:uncharacterized membrane protein YgaE (UPF0421/DUF939 family)